MGVFIKRALRDILSIQIRCLSQFVQRFQQQFNSCLKTAMLYIVASLQRKGKPRAYKPSRRSRDAQRDVWPIVDLRGALRGGFPLDRSPTSAVTGLHSIQYPVPSTSSFARSNTDKRHPAGGNEHIPELNKTIPKHTGGTQG